MKPFYQESLRYESLFNMPRIAPFERKAFLEEKRMQKWKK